jgi:hypothetical protein
MELQVAGPHAKLLRRNTPSDIIGIMRGEGGRIVIITIVVRGDFEETKDTAGKELGNGGSHTRKAHEERDGFA